jgi:nucleoside-diphosphate-sugar epimerase
MEANMSPTSSRRTVLLTGASGVVGQALLPRLRDGGADIVCLTHHSQVSGPGVSSVHGDVTQPHFGLAAGEWQRVVSSVDAVIHAAAVTQFNGTDAALQRTNVDGTGHALELAAVSGVPLYYVSSAYLHAREDGERGRTAVRYAATKRAAEDLVRSSGVPHVIVRPSIVVGDSRTGVTSAFQGLHQVADGILRGIVPIIPFDGSWPIDIVPQDVVADAIATLVEQESVGGEWWLTAGAAAPSLAATVEVLLGVAAETGSPVSAPRFVDPETFDRLIAPVFMEALPAHVRKTVTRLLDFFAAYLALEEAMPSDLPRLAELGVMRLPDSRESLRQSLRFWIEQTGASAAPAGAVA